jgi:DedD protein
VSDTDDLEIKKQQARRRVFGAVALMLLAAIVLPRAMDQEPPPVDDIQISIPAREAVPPPQPRASAPTQPPPTQPPISPSSAQPVGQPPAPENSAREAEDAARAAEAARVRALLDGAPEKAPAAVSLASPSSLPPSSASPTYIVQVAAFTDATKAASLVAELKKQGFAAYTEKAGNNMIRVRVGPAGGKSQGEQTVARLKELGHSGATLARR